MAAGKKQGASAHAKAQAAKGAKPTSYDPALPVAMAPAPEIIQPRPAKSRYPITMEAFQALKTQVHRDVARAIPKGMTIVRAKPPSSAPAALAAGLAAAPSINVDGIPATTSEPPDCTCAAGPGHVLIAVNASVAIHDKSTGKSLLQRTLGQWFGSLGKGMMLFDPKACYDQFDDRYVLVVMGRDEATKRSVFLVSVSKTSDPMSGGWFNFTLDATVEGTKKMNQWADYPGLGYDHRAIYLTANMFTWGDQFSYAKLRILDKTQIYSGKAPTFVDIAKLKEPGGGYAFTVLPCQCFGAPNDFYLVNATYPNAQGATTLVHWTLTDPLGKPKLKAVAVNVANFSIPPSARQPGGTLASDDTRLQNAVFRSGSLWTALTSAQVFGAGAASPPSAAVRWYQIEAGTAKLLQQGALGNASEDLFYPSVQPDSNNEVDVYFCRSSKTRHGSLAVATRRPADPPGSLGAVRPIVAGLTTYGGNRWGDYNGIACDPGVPGAVWCYGVYAGPGGKWATRLARI